MQPARPEVRSELAGPDPVCEVCRPAAPQVRPRPALCQLPVQEHGQLELVAEQVAEHERLRARGAAIVGIEVDDRGHVDRADARVDALVLVQIDLADRLGRTVQHGPREVPGLAGEREHAPMVVGVRVDVEQARVERPCDLVDGRLVAAFGDVRDREQRRRHYPST